MSGARAEQAALPDVLVDDKIRPPLLWQVWIDSNLGIISPPCWEENSDPQPLATALDEAADCRQRGYPTRILPCGLT